MLDPHRLRIFRSVLASESLGAAADNLGMSSSAVSQHLSALQRETGLTLFRREGRGLVPTPVAMTLQAETDELMGLLGRLDGLVADLREGRTGRLTIGYFPSVGAGWIAPLAARLTDEMPGITLDFVISNLPSGRGKAPDVNIVVEAPDTPAHAGYRRTDLLADAYVATLHRDHRLAGADSIHLSDLKDERWIANSDLRDIHTRLVTEACEAAGFRPRYVVQSQDYLTGMEFVAAGIGVTVLPGISTRVHPENVVTVPIRTPRPVRHICALSRERTAHPAAVELVVDLLTEIAGRTVAATAVAPSGVTGTPAGPAPD